MPSINQRSPCVETRLASRARSREPRLVRCLFAAHWRAARLRPHIDLKHRGQREEGEGTFVIDFVVKEAGESKAGGQGNGTTLPCVRIPWQQTAPKLPSRPQARSPGRRRRTLTSDTLGRFFGDNKGKKALVLCGSPPPMGSPFARTRRGGGGLGLSGHRRGLTLLGSHPAASSLRARARGLDTAIPVTERLGPACLPGTPLPLPLRSIDQSRD